MIAATAPVYILILLNNVSQTAIKFAELVWRDVSVSWVVEFSSNGTDPQVSIAKLAEQVPIEVRDLAHWAYVLSRINLLWNPQGTDTALRAHLTAFIEDAVFVQTEGHIRAYQKYLRDLGADKASSVSNGATALRNALVLLWEQGVNFLSINEEANRAAIQVNSIVKILALAFFEPINSLSSAFFAVAQLNYMVINYNPWWILITPKAGMRTPAETIADANQLEQTKKVVRQMKDALQGLRTMTGFEDAFAAAAQDATDHARSLRSYFITSISKTLGWGDAEVPIVDDDSLRFLELTLAAFFGPFARDSGYNGSLGIASGVTLARNAAIELSALSSQSEEPLRESLQTAARGLLDIGILI